MSAPPIPASCAHRPTIGGVVVPAVNVRLADGGVDFRSPHQAMVRRCWMGSLCQTCGESTGPTAVLMGGPNQVAAGRFDEPPLCPPCAVYASRACPMVAGRQSHYATREHLAYGQRGHTCSEPGCDCGGWVPSDPNTPDRGGDPAHAWYACYLPAGAWTVLARRVQTRCTDQGCEHDRLLIDSGRITQPPRKIVEVSVPGAGRTWRTLSPAEVALLTGGAQ